MGLDSYPEIPEVEETGTTFEENALLKACTIAKATGLVAVADDSGLEVDALNGAPGVYSARFSDGDTTLDVDLSRTRNNVKLLRELIDTPTSLRTARFRCVMAVAT